MKSFQLLYSAKERFATRAQTKAYCPRIFLCNYFYFLSLMFFFFVCFARKWNSPTHSSLFSLFIDDFRVFLLTNKILSSIHLSSMIRNVSIERRYFHWWKIFPFKNNIAIGGKYLKTILGEQYFTRRKIFPQEMLETWIDK